MSDLVKTLIFLGAAAVVALLAFFTRPGDITHTPHEAVGKPLFADFTDPLTAKSLEIVYMDPEGLPRGPQGELAAVDRLEVKEVDGIWVVASHKNYPADAENRMRDAATALIDLNVVNLASEFATDHEMLGVVEPSPETTPVGAKGVGRLVVVKDAQGKSIAQLIIGKKLPSDEQQRFVRIPGQDAVFTAKLDADKLPSKFADWIKQDLLAIDSYDIEELVLKDYSVTGVVADGRPEFLIDRRFDMTVGWNSSDYKWDLKSLEESKDGKLVKAELPHDEELNKEKLDALKESLAKLKIVDVEPKPKGLTADLRADKDFINDLASMRSLVTRGFYPFESRDGYELLSSNGEVLVHVKDGVEYVLRFGQSAETESGGDAEGLNRYLFVTARINEGAFTRPEMEKLPQPKPKDDAEEKKPAEEKP